MAMNIKRRTLVMNKCARIADMIIFAALTAMAAFIALR